ncbi:esterase-like activity of phytase family protein [Brevibacillus fortis]|uniref:Phytase-like domain-containing protein n=1 Tax=Brevibacillus fortis TaxID=2126352 RepID=A0A2P7VDN6_9BACL|nr:esterase-like activity of phytase family protein [Brevibacillus fortis]PSJ97302.1 hypothetical protein C7R93_09280 [Brevibacillus fortis]
MKKWMYTLTASLVLSTLFGYGPTHASGTDSANVHNGKARSVGSLSFIGEKTIPFNQQFEGTTVGGLSGIHYDPKQGQWLIISDDRSDKSPARFYQAKLAYDHKQFQSVQLSGVTFLKQPNGSEYPNQKLFATQGGEIPDLEDIAVDPKNGTIWYTTEGSRTHGMNPSVKHATRDGKYLSSFPAYKLFTMSPKYEIGPRQNQTFEGLSFSPDGSSLWVAMENAVYQDGGLPTVNAGSLSRITQYDRNGNLKSQYAYPVDAIPAKPGPGKYADNGVTSILAVNDHQLLLTERAGVEGADGTFTFHVRVYEIDTAGASDISNLDLILGKNITPVKKRLVLDLSKSGLRHIDNIEGITWGPKLPNGHDSLVLVSDNNFASTQTTQFLAFEVLPKK